MTSCVSNFTLSVKSVCDCSTDWTSPGDCRLRIKGYVDGVLTACPLATVNGSAAWDGTFPTLSLGQFLANGGFSSSISGHLFVGASIFKVGDHWDLNIVGDSSGVGSAMWVGVLTSACPVGVFTRTDGCQPGPATFEVEGYKP